MLGRQSREHFAPFSYLTVCRTITGIVWVLLFASAQIIIVHEQIRTPLGPGPDLLLAVGVAFAITAVFYVLLTSVVWKFLHPDLRASLAYDADEATRGKGTIHSYRDLWRWMRHRPHSNAAV